MILLSFYAHLHRIIASCFRSSLRYLLANPSKAHPLLRPNLHLRARAAEHAGHGSLHSRHDDVQWINLFTSLGSRALQVPRTRDAVGRVVFDWRVGCACGEGKACFTKSTIDTGRNVGEGGSQ
jgi:hypothetical protein